ncbi:hypothetical protein Taro_033560 [Colocasia esculenta]|uniref:Uncharacterized protein n=1 Tax=Colocasia esculenta TaxID=4460 RepID=A0A843W1V5_COLES|nr:hypothetical protein [Colocasia esculenta]
MASRGRRGGASAHEDEARREERAEQQAPAPQGPVLPPPPPVDYGVFMLKFQLKTMVDLPSWKDSRGSCHPLLRGRAIRY